MYGESAVSLSSLSVKVYEDGAVSLSSLSQQMYGDDAISQGSLFGLCMEMVLYL